MTNFRLTGSYFLPSYLRVFTVIKTSFQNISITLLRFCLNFTNIEATVLEKKAPVNDFVRFPCRESLLK